MNYETWKTLSQAERAAHADYSGLSSQLVGLEGYRVEVQTTYGEKRRFIVGRSTGWKPCHLEIHNRRSMGGGCAEQNYSNVKILYKVR